MWNNYQVEMQNPGRIDDHLAQARKDRLEAEARGNEPRRARLATAVEGAMGAVSSRTVRFRHAAKRAAALVGHVPHPHSHRSAVGHHGA